MKQKGVLIAVPWELNQIGGVTQVVTNLSKAVHDNFTDLQPIIMIPKWSNILPQITNEQSVTSIRQQLRSPGSENENKVFTWLKFILWFPVFFVSILYLKYKFNIKAINIHYPVVTFYGLYLAAKLLRINIITSLHGADVTTFHSMDKRMRKYFLAMLGMTNKYVCCSEGFLSTAKNTFSFLNEENSTYIHNGIDIESLANPLPASLVKEHSNYILTLGTFEHKKGHDVLIKAFKLLSNQHSETKLIIAGRDAPTRIATEKLIFELGLNDKIIIKTNLSHEHAMNLLENCRVFVLPSRVEPFGIVLLEAGFFSKPVIASKVGGIPEIISDEVNGLLVESENPELLSEKIQSVLNNKEYSSKLSKELNHNVIETFTWQNAANKYVQIWIK